MARRKVRGTKMQAVQFNRKLATENEVMNIIFDACRANETREEKKVGNCIVKFYPFIGKDFQAVVYDHCYTECGSAIVDSFDC